MDTSRPCNALDPDGNYCQQLVNNDTKFCSKCGTKISPPVAKKKPPDIDSVYHWPCQGRLEDGTNCGHDLTQAIRFCSSCGTKVGQPVCRHCLTPLDRVDKFCQHCGETLTRDAPETDRGPPLTDRNTPLTDRNTPLTDRNTPLTDRNTPLTDRNTPLTDRGPPLTDTITPLTDRGPPLTDRNTPLTDRSPPVTDRNTPLTDRGPPVTDRNTPLTDRGPPLTDRNTPLTERGPPLTERGPPRESPQPGSPSSEYTPTGLSPSSNVDPSGTYPNPGSNFKRRPPVKPRPPPVAPKPKNKPFSTGMGAGTTPGSTLGRADSLRGSFRQQKQKGQNGLSSEVMDIEFQVIVESAFKFNESNDSVYIMFKNLELGGYDWAKPQHRLHVSRRLADRAFLMTGKIAIPVHILQTGPQDYRYCVISKHQHRADTSAWEATKDNRPRSLQKERHAIQAGGRADQYDGIMMKTLPYGFFSATTNKKEVLMAVREMLPRQTGDAWRAEDVIGRIGHLRHCMGGWSMFSNERESDPFFKEGLTEYLFRLIDQLITLNTSMRLAAVMSAIILREKHKLELDSQENQHMMKALHIRPSEKNSFVEEYMKFAESHFYNTLKSDLAGYLKRFITTHLRVTKGDIRWFFCIPMVHFLEGKCKPFEAADIIFEEDHRSSRWWGTDGMEDIVDMFKRDDKGQEQLHNILERSQPLFRVDWLLPRTILASLGPQYIPVILDWKRMPPEAVFAMVFYHINTRSMKPQQVTDILQEIHLVSPSMLGMYNDGPGETNKTRICHIANRIICDILSEVMERTLAPGSQMSNTSVTAVAKMALNASQAEHVWSKKQGYDEERTLDEQHREAAELCRWLKAWLPQREMSSILDAMTDLLSIEFHEDVKTTVRADVLDTFKDLVSKTKPATLVNEFTRLQVGHHHQDLVDIFIARVFDELATSLSSQRYGSITGSTTKALQMLSNMFMNSWPKSTDDRDILNHVLTWPSYKRFLHLSLTSDLGTRLTEDCQRRFGHVKALLGKTVSDLVTGDLLLSHLGILTKYRDSLCEIIHILRVNNSRWINEGDLLEILDRRQTEYDKLLEQKDHVRHLVTLTSDLSRADFTLLMECINRVQADPKLSECCNIDEYNFEKRTFTTQGLEVIIFGFSLEEEEILQELSQRKGSQVFRKIWRAKGQGWAERKMKDQRFNHKEILQNVWPKAEKAWRFLIKNIRNGSCQTKAFDQHFGELYKREGQVERELIYMFPEEDKSRMQKRLQQITCYKTLEQLEYSAQILIEAKGKLSLKGDFASIEGVLRAKQEYNHTVLNDFGDNLATAGRALEFMSENLVDCINVFLKCQPLVEWLHQHVKRLQELQTLVDLAMSSASGEGSLEVNMVTCLNAAVSGFAPLIYDLKRSDGFNELREKAELVCQAWDKDEKLFKKLENLNDRLDWLKGVRESQGNIEKNTRKQVEAINNRGIYIVGHDDETPAKSANDIIRVKVLPEDGKVKVRMYTGSDLKDLQSKLMLVARKGDQEVDSFVEKFDGVTGLANTFMNLCTAGNVLFKTLTATFFCDERKSSNAVVTFFLSNRKLTGLQKDANVTQQINQVREFMEKCLIQWRQFIEEKRTEFPELNHYTTEQLVMLCKELAAKPEDVTSMVFALLHDVRQDCTMEQLQKAIRTTVAEAKSRDSSASDVAKELYAIFSPQVVQRALDMCQGDHDQLEFLCLELENEDQGIEADVQDASDSRNLRLIQSEHTVRDMTEQLMEELSSQDSNLRKKLEMLWNRFFNSASMSTIDCLSIDDLGRILRHLADRVILGRSLPPYLKAGKPNLVVCPQRDLLRRVTSVYAENMDLPLPSRNEVLLCNEETTAEDVDLLVRRAVTDKTGRIFMLANVHLLTYEVACNAEAAIEKHSKESDSYHLAIVCSSEEQNRAHLVTVLDMYRVDTLGRPPLDLVIRYLQKHLTGITGQGASEVDPEGRCVRVVHSDCQGMGKTLWVKRRSEDLLDTFPQQAGTAGARVITLPVFGRTVKVKTVVQAFLPFTPDWDEHIPSLFHINIPHEMEAGVDHLLFNLVVLGSLVHPAGEVWRRNRQDLYILEITPLLHWKQGSRREETNNAQSVHHILELLPTVTCRTPMESLDVIMEQYEDPRLHNWSDSDQLADVEKFRSESYLRVYQNLRRHMEGNATGEEPEELQQYLIDCLRVILKYCGLKDPTWAEVSHFVRFLNVQLKACEKSIFCRLSGPLVLPGFMDFVVRFMIQMSKDFSTRSLNMAEENHGPMAGTMATDHDRETATEDEELLQFQLRRHWETSPHPYIFFNPDEATMTFLGFLVQLPHCDVVDPQTNQVIAEKIMSKRLFDDLLLNRVDLGENFDKLSRMSQIAKLRMVMGSQPPEPVTPEVGSNGISESHIQPTPSNTQWPPKPPGQPKSTAQLTVIKQSKFKWPPDPPGPPVSQRPPEPPGPLKPPGPLRSFRLPRPPSEPPAPPRPPPRQIQNASPELEKPMPPGYDPDDKYVLTADNAKKILAIQMRFRSNIPVVIMGETGCGKTYLIKFMCSLQCPPGKHKEIRNMMLMKVHGGTTEADVIRKVTEAEELARENRRNYPDMFTVLFLDEVNTTEALGLVKEVLCDNSLNGRPLDPNSGLRLIAACNPYRKHSKEVIQKLEKAGLGYHVKADETSDKLGRIPMRQLVYRVQPLPQSLLPLVWDFGQLQPHAEKLFVFQIVRKKLETGRYQGITSSTPEILTEILAAAQEFMREEQNECSFVSLRDVERTMDVMTWFYEHKDMLYPRMNKFREDLIKMETKNIQEEEEDAEDEGEQGERNWEKQVPDDMTRSLILALGVCYHACLNDTRENFRRHINAHFKGTFKLEGGERKLKQEISLCQDVFLNEIKLEPTIARNQALKENVFMMVVCIELRLPLFLVGKPGSSKSLAKTIVADAMQGPNSSSPFFKELKHVTMRSYQCSPLSTPDDIVLMFRQCAELQKEKGDLDKFVDVVVLDEIGLAEDSPQMPLKALHPLLEDGCEGDGEAEKYMKVGFIGISNWALDPAKMNRGILVQRGPFDVTELEKTARDICSSDTSILEHIEPLMSPLAVGFLDLYGQAIEVKREFYGLRDFYSLVKMVYGFAKNNEGMPTWPQLEHAILRNFGGLDGIQAVDRFWEHLKNIIQRDQPTPSDPKNTATDLVQASIRGDGINGESRYLLVMTENYAALTFLQNLNLLENANIIYGSSFPSDQDYVVVCRNINQIKVCMETGQTVVLLNLESLYESLYDVLNQYYTHFGGERYVNLGLRSHRMKSSVNDNFKLIVVAEKRVVYERFPIPLINRLEKHFVAMSTALTAEQHQLVETLSQWVDSFIKVPAGIGRQIAQPKASDVIIGYHHDACASTVLHVCSAVAPMEQTETFEKEVIRRSKELLLQCATPEAVIRRYTNSANVDKDILDTYFKQQHHNSLIDYLKAELFQSLETSFMQVTTHSRLLPKAHMEEIAAALDLPATAINSEFLQAFNTKHQFSRLLRKYFSIELETDQVLLIQCDSGDKNAELIACARFCVMEEYQQALQNLDTNGANLQTKRHVVLLIQLPRVAGGCFTGFQGNKWRSVHLDELRAEQYQLPPFDALMTQSVSSLIGAALERRFTIHTRRDSLVELLQDNGTTQLALDRLLQSCIHRASVMLKEKADGTKNTLRIYKLLDILKRRQNVASTATETAQDDHKMFLDIMKERIFLLLQEKEEIRSGPMASGWFCDKVASVESVNTAGTFRRSLWQHLELKVTPILAGIIAFLDTNDNLRLFGETGWQQRMWLECFKDSRLTQITYEDLLSSKDQTELNEMTVRMTGAGGKPMEGRFPFSWVLKSYIENLVNEKQKVEAAKKDVTKPVGHLLKQSPWWPILEAAFTEAGHEVVRDCYLEDYVRMVYKPQTSESGMEYELVRRMIAAAVIQLEEAHSGDTDHEPPLDLEHQLPMIHIAEAEIHSRLQVFSEIAAKTPSLIEHLRKFPEDHPGHPLTSTREMALDILAVHFLVERVQTDYTSMKNLQSCRKWQHQVDKTSPLVNTVLARADRLTNSGAGGYSPDCLRYLNEIRVEWNRVTSVKLFAEIVYPEGVTGEENLIKHGPPFLRKLALIEADFKTERTMRSVEGYLKTVILNASGVKQCPGCKEPMVTALIMPSCGHQVCEECVEGLREADDFTCLTCKTAYPREQALKRKQRTTAEMKALRGFKDQCNSFFMEVISRMCFAGNTPPEPGVVNMLMGYVTKQAVRGRQKTKKTRTKEIEVFSNQLDPTPMVRSVLLQLLLRSSFDHVHQHLLQYFTEIQTDTSPNTDNLELAVLYVQCLEDYYFNMGPAASEERDRVQYAIYLLQETHRDLDRRKDEATQFEAVAKARLALSITAEWLVKVCILKEPPLDLTEQLFSSAQVLCSQSDAPGPSGFLIRQIARCHSFNELVQVTKQFPWVIPDGASQQQNAPAPDQFVIWGDAYKQVRDTLNQSIIEGNIRPFIAALTGSQREHILLAIFHEVTSAYVRQDANTRPAPKTIEALKECKTAPELRSVEGLVERLLTNRLAENCPHLALSPKLRPGDLALVEVVAHFRLTALTTNNLVKPIVLLATNPASAKGSLLPTMPEDERKYIHEALRVASQNTMENPVIYECPKGHTYVIGNCGRPWIKQKCPTCGEPIGGKMHELEGQNKLATLDDQTKQGHCLGPAANRSLVPAPERTMSPACTALVRLLVHLGMYIGANSCQKEVHDLVTPPIKKQEVPTFLWQHMLHDLEVLSRAVGKGKDDTLLLVHLLIRDISMTDHGIDQGAQLMTREQRLAWETQFSEVLVMPIVNNLEERLSQANQQITSDSRQGNNILRHLIHETNVGVATGQAEVSAAKPVLWRFRTRVSIEHLTQEMSTFKGKDNQECELLHLFLEKEPVLQAIQLIPTILELLTCLSAHYHRKIDRREAESLKMKDFLGKTKNVATRLQCEVWFEDLKKAWKTVHDYLVAHGARGQEFQAEYFSQEMTEETPLSMFLPNTRGCGQYVIALLNYLTSVHNNFMREYHNVTKKELRPEVSFPDLTPAHLITYDPDRDLLPLVMANCTYSLEVGQGTKIEYNFKQLERQLEERFIRGKGTLGFQLETMSFREDLNNAVLFGNLSQKINQKPFSPAIQNELQADARIMVVVSDCLANLDIAIGFLVSVGGDPEMSLYNFMTDTLQMEEGALTTRARQHCKLCHTKALWLLFAHEREKMILRNNQEPFTSIDCQDYRVELSADQVKRLQEALHRMNVDHFLSELHECILLHITIKASQYDEDHVDNKDEGLAMFLYVYIDNKDGPEIAALTNSTFPADIKVEQCVNTWRVACQFLQRTPSLISRQ